jgi:ribonuclease E
LDLVFHNNEINEHILEKYQINKTIQKALQPRVDLPSGGYIIIEPTEALTVIDVNSGSFTRSANSRQTVLWTNCEAAIEISRQMKLRNIGGVLVIDFIDMESRRDQFQLLEHFTLAIKDDSARPQIAQLTELGLVELTRKRQGQNIYELFGTKCTNCNGLGHKEKLPNYKNISLKTNQNAKKSSKIEDTKTSNLTPIQLIENQETIISEELTKTKNTNKEDDHSNKRGNDNESPNTNNRREKKVITVELSNDEKIVYSQLGINPLIKLGKEYLSSNHLVRLEDVKNKEKDDSEQNVKTNNKVTSKNTNKITSTFDSKEEVEADYSKEVNPDIKLPKVTNEKEEIETTDEMDNSRRKRRRSSANIE